MNLRILSLVGVLSGAATVATAETHIGIGLSIGVPAPIIVREAPPRRMTETVVVSPGPGYIWVAGHHSWRNGQWVWLPGMWITPPQPSAIWVEGRMDERSRAWTEGHWEISPPPPVVVMAPPSPQVEVIFQGAPPPPRHEQRGHAPGRDFVWINGYWAGRGGRQMWIAGRWDRPPHGHHAWVEPRWERRGGSYVFIDGRWN